MKFGCHLIIRMSYIMLKEMFLMIFNHFHYQGMKLTENGILPLIMRMYVKI